MAYAVNNVATMSLRIARVACTALIATVFHISAGLSQTSAPITPSGLSTQVNLSGTSPPGTVQYDITGGTRAGANLFHSFGDFNVHNNHIANFLNNTGLATENILSRVTGGNPSNIYGIIQTTGFENANLFLMNPSGIVFGPNASLNVGGSVTFTTADYLRLDKTGGPNAGIFHASPIQASLLTSAPVDAFGFLGSNPGSINVQGSQLTVPAGKGILLIGGNITIQSGPLENGTAQSARLSAPNGQIYLATARSPGEFLQDLTATPVSFRSFGSAHLTPGSTVDVSHTGNGKVSIRGGHFALDIQNAVLDTANNSSPTAVAPGQDTIILAPRSSIVSQTSSLDRAPDIRINADRITILGVPGSKENFFNKPFTGIKNDTQGDGNAGDIVLQATGDLEITKVVNIQSVAMPKSTGAAGNIQLISTHGNILMTGGGREAQVFSLTESSGNTGNVTASADEGDIVLDGGNLYTLSQGPGGGGSVKINAKNLSMHAGLLSNDNFLSTSKPGGIMVTLSGKLTMTADPSLELPDFVFADSLIVTSSYSEAPAADITIAAKDIVVTQGSLINNAAFASGPGGNLKIVADTLQVTDGAQISSGSTRAPNRGTLPQNINPTGQGGNITIQGPLSGPRVTVLIDGSGSGIFTNSEGSGAGGTINLSTKTLTIQNGGTISAETLGKDALATGGSIFVTAKDQVTLTNGASITASSTGPADAGNISVDAGRELDIQDSSITAEARLASGGNIDIKAIDLIRLTNSKISSSVQGGPSTAGGNITIDPKAVVLQNAQILASAQQGNGGNISIITPLFLADPRSVVDASSQFGLSGSVTIQSPTSNLSGTVGQLASKTSPPQVLLQNRCVALAGGEQSTFILAGREALPSQPGGWLSSPVAMEHWTGEGMEEHASGLMVRRVGPRESSTVMTQANGTEVLSLRRLTPSSFLVRSFAESALTGCRT